MCNLTEGQLVLLKSSPITANDHGFRRAKFINMNEHRGMFHLVDFGKRVMASASSVYPLKVKNVSLSLEYRLMQNLWTIQSKLRILSTKSRMTLGFH